MRHLAPNDQNRIPSPEKVHELEERALKGKEAEEMAEERRRKIRGILQRIDADPMSPSFLS